MTAGERLAALSGMSGVTAGSHMYAISVSGLSAGDILVSRSSLASATAAQHLLSDSAAIDPYAPHCRGFMVNMGSFMGMR